MVDAIGARTLRACAWRAGLVGLALALAASGVGAATIAVDVTRQGDALRIEASTVLDADVATAWRVLTDYDRYVEFIPDLRASRVVRRQDGKVTVEQEGDATLWLVRIPLAITFEITEFPPARLQSRSVAGSLRELESTYLLTEKARGVRLEYRGRVATGFGIFGPIEHYAVERNIARQFQALADAIERRSAGAAVQPPGVTGAK